MEKGFTSSDNFDSFSFIIKFLIVEPIVKMLNYEKDENISVSLSSHFFGESAITSKFTKDVVYRTTNGVELKLDIWSGHGDSKQSPHPAIVKVNGGGWGDKEFS